MAQNFRASFLFAGSERVAIVLGPLLPFLSATGLSLLWLIIFSLSVTSGADWPGMGNLPPVGLAAIISAAVLPMGLIWAVTAVVSQTLSATPRRGRVIRPRRGHDDSESITRTMIMMQEQARRRAFLDSNDLGLRDLCAHLGQIMDRLNIIDTAEMETQWALTSAGYPWAIPNTFLYCAEKSGPGFSDRLAELLAEDGPSAAALQRFLRRHTLLEELSRNYDEDRLLRAILEDSPMGQVALMLTRVDARMRILLGEPAPTTDHPQPPKPDPEPAQKGDFDPTVLDPLKGLKNTGESGSDEDWAALVDTSSPRGNHPTEHPIGTAPPPAGSRSTVEPTKSPEDVTRRLPYPPLHGPDVADLQERVIRSLSRSPLGQAPHKQAQGEQLDVFGEGEDPLEVLETDQPPAKGRTPPPTREG